jgi:hypothetical protein
VYVCVDVVVFGGDLNLAVSALYFCNDSALLWLLIVVICALSKPLLDCSFRGFGAVNLLVGLLPLDHLLVLVVDLPFVPQLLELEDLLLPYTPPPERVPHVLREGLL